MKHVLDEIVSGIALLIMPFIGLAASAHAAEDTSQGEAALFAFASVVIFLLLLRMFWQSDRARRLHRNR